MVLPLESADSAPLDSVITLPIRPRLCNTRALSIGHFLRCADLVGVEVAGLAGVFGQLGICVDTGKAARSCRARRRRCCGAALVALAADAGLARGRWFLGSGRFVRP